MADTAEKVKEIIVSKLGVDAAQVTPEASFTNDLGADSSTQLNWSWNLRKHSTSKFRMRMQKKLPNVSDVLNYLKSKGI